MRVGMVAMALLFVVPGCAWLQEQLRPAQPPRPGWAVIEVDKVTFDGEDLNFRLLVGAHDGGVLLDRRLVPNTNLDLRAVWDCDGGIMLYPHYIFDFFPDVPGPSDLLEIREYDWFGGEIDFPIFIASEDGGNVPSCVVADFHFHPESAANPLIPLRVMGSRPIPQEADAGQP